MKAYITDAENRGEFSATPDDWGDLYRQAADSLEMGIPPDMADRIMAGLDAMEQESQGARFEDSETSGKKPMFPVYLPAGFVQRGKAITVAFGKYAASVAACFVLALGMFTMSGEAGRGIIGLGSGNNASVASEIPVKAHAKVDRSGQKRDPSAAPRMDHPDQDQAATQSAQPEENNQPADAEASGTGHDTDTSQERQAPVASAEENQGAASGGHQTDPGVHSGVSGSEDNPSSETEVSSSEERTDHSSSTGTTSTQTNTENQAGNSSRSNGGSVEDRGQDYPVPEIEEHQTTESPPEDSGNSESSQNTESQQPEVPARSMDPPFVFDSTHPVKELEEISQLPDVMGYQPVVVSPVPTGWNISSIEVIWGITAQITYSNGLDSVLYRTSARASVLSSDSGNYGFRKESEGYILEGDAEDSVSLMTWVSGDSSYSMSFDRPVTEQEALEWAGSVSALPQTGNE